MERAGIWLALAALCFGACARSERAASELAAACFSGVELGAWDRKIDVHAWCEAEIDRGADGDRDARREQAFDADGQLIRQVEETGEETRIERDELGRITLIEQIDADGVLVSTDRSSYDGRTRRIVSDSDADGETDLLMYESYECFPAEHEWPFPGPCTAESDWDLDGVPELTTENEWNEDGLLESAFETSAKGGVLRAHYFYEDGETIRIEYDDDDDGTINRSWHAEEIDAFTHVSWLDSDGDGERDSWEETVVDDEGRVVSHARYEDRELSWRIESVWSRDGRSVRETRTKPEQPTWGWISETRYDSAGNIVGVATDHYPLGSVDECTYVSYSCWDE